MFDLIVGLICLILALAVVLIRKGYFSSPLYELKRQAARGDAYAKTVYPVAAYSTALRSLLWLLLAFFTAVSLVEFDRFAPLAIGVILDALLLWLAFSWLPNSNSSPINRNLTLLVNPFFSWVMHWAYPGLNKLDHLLKFYGEPHTRLYESEDLSDLIDKQLKQADNRINQNTLKRAKKLIAFDSALVKDYRLGWKDIMRLTASDQIGPKLLDELFHSGQTSFPVTQIKGGKDIVGILNRDSVGLSSQGFVKDFMQPNITAVKEEDKLEHALHKFSSGGQTMFIVLNKDNKVSGVLTLKDCLEAIMKVELTDDIPSEQEINQRTEYETAEIDSGGTNENT